MVLTIIPNLVLSWVTSFAVRTKVRLIRWKKRGFIYNLVIATPPKNMWVKLGLIFGQECNSTKMMSHPTKVRSIFLVLLNTPENVILAILIGTILKFWPRLTISLKALSSTIVLSEKA